MVFFGLASYTCNFTYLEMVRDFEKNYELACKSEPLIVREHLNCVRILDDLFFKGEKSKYYNMTYDASSIVAYSVKTKLRKTQEASRKARRTVYLEDVFEDKVYNTHLSNFEINNTEAVQSFSDPLDLFLQWEEDEVLPLYKIGKIEQQIYQETKLSLEELVRTSIAAGGECKKTNKKLIKLSEVYDIQEAIKAILYYTQKGVKIPKLVSLKEVEVKVEEIKEKEGVSLLDLIEDILTKFSKEAVQELKVLCEKYDISDGLITTLDCEYFKEKI